MTIFDNVKLKVRIVKFTLQYLCKSGLVSLTYCQATDLVYLVGDELKRLEA